MTTIVQIISACLVLCRKLLRSYFIFVTQRWFILCKCNKFSIVSYFVSDFYVVHYYHSTWYGGQSSCRLVLLPIVDYCRFYCEQVKKYDYRKYFRLSSISFVFLTRYWYTTAVQQLQKISLFIPNLSVIHTNSEI